MRDHTAATASRHRFAASARSALTVFVITDREIKKRSPTNASMTRRSGHVTHRAYRRRAPIPPAITACHPGDGRHHSVSLFNLLSPQVGTIADTWFCVCAMAAATVTGWISGKQATRLAQAP